MKFILVALMVLLASVQMFADTDVIPVTNIGVGYITSDGGVSGKTVTISTLYPRSNLVLTFNDDGVQKGVLMLFPPEVNILVTALTKFESWDSLATEKGVELNKGITNIDAHYFFTTEDGNSHRGIGAEMIGLKFLTLATSRRHLLMVALMPMTAEDDEDLKYYPATWLIDIGQVEVLRQAARGDFTKTAVVEFFKKKSDDAMFK